MIEKTIRDYLAEALGVDVYMEMPRTMPQGEFVLIDRTGRRELDHIITSTFAFQSYAPSLAMAAALNDRVESAVKGLTSLNSISAARFNTSYNFTDTTTKNYRYQCVFDITHF